MSLDKFKKYREEEIDDICECDDLYEDLEITEAEYQGKTVKLNDPIRTSELNLISTSTRKASEESGGCLNLAGINGFRIMLKQSTMLWAEIPGNLNGNY